MTGRGFKFGRLFGIEIRVDWSWLFIFFLTTWNLSVAFGQFHPDWGGALRWGLAVLAALLFFASVLAHELAHSLVARARGIPVRSITLFLFGGVSNIQREPPSPGTEFIMALLGPVVSLVIGFTLTILTTLSVGQQLQGTVQDPNQALQNFGPLATLFLWLGSINIILGFFNLIPGFPLDGGRILRSAFWALTDDLRKATRWASWVGQGIAWLMILAGIAMTFGVTIPFFGSGFINGLWLAFIGWFLHNAASRGYRRVVIQDVLEDVEVRRMMWENPPVVAADVTVERLVDHYIMRSDDQSFPVMENEQLVGMVALDDVRKVPKERRAEVRVEEIMTLREDLVIVGPHDEASEALYALARREIRQLPVVSDGSLVGLVRRRDIVKWLQLQSELELT
jgi:Zn-dependent protease/CBS domain-containing protein